MADLQDFHFQSLVTILGDLGFLGYTKEHVCMSIPFKKPKNQELTQEQKDYNKSLASERVSIEHVFAHCKTWRVIKEIFRTLNYFRRHSIFVIACKLHNFRTHFRQIPYSS